MRFPGSRPDLVDVRYDTADRGGEIDVVLADFDAAFPDGVLLEIAVWRDLAGGGTFGIRRREIIASVPGVELWAPELFTSEPAMQRLTGQRP